MTHRNEATNLPIVVLYFVNPDEFPVVPTLVRVLIQPTELLLMQILINILTHTKVSYEPTSSNR